MRSVFMLMICVVSSFTAAGEFVTATTAAVGQQANVAIPTPEERRCAYVGRSGSFHIIGPRGTAAYRFRQNGKVKEWVAEMEVGEPNADWWVYNQIPSDTADPEITAWAFARQPCNGKVASHDVSQWLLGVL